MFGFNRWDSVALLQMFCGELSFLHMCALYKWNFTCDVHIGLRPAPVYFLQSVLSQECNVMSMYSSIYSDAGLSRAHRLFAVKAHFEEQCLANTH